MATHPLDVIRALASAYPEAEKAFLFGDHEVYRVRGKVFVWLGEGERGGTYLGVKLKDSQAAALSLPFTSPMAYGMAKWGWVDADFPKGKFPPALVAAWIAESYRHTAPKKLLARIEAVAAPAAPAKATPARAKQRGARTAAARRGRHR